MAMMGQHLYGIDATRGRVINHYAEFYHDQLQSFQRGFGTILG